jgi:hypothetical protein
MLGHCSVILLASSVSAAHAATYTVGADGTHATVQAAIDAALAASGSDEIRVAEGTFSEHLDFTPGGLRVPVRYGVRRQLRVRRRAVTAY